MNKEATIEYFYLGDFRSLDVPRDLAQVCADALTAKGARSVKVYFRYDAPHNPEFRGAAPARAGEDY